MVLIVNTTDDGFLTGEVSEELAARGVEYQVIETGDMYISNCIGCNYCFLKTPGVCCIKDDYQEIFKKIINADQFWVITDTALGFMNHKGKNVFDRILPALNMYLEFRGKQMRHTIRYGKSPDIGVIYRGKADGDYMNKWNERCTANLDSRPLGAYEGNCWKEATACMQ